MGRVAGDALVIGCPTDEEWVVQADAAANDRWKELFGHDYEWLQEHRDYGLVNAAEVVSILESQGLHVVVLTQGCATLWESLMGVHFMKVKFPELEGLSTAADRLYNTRVFAGDCVGPCYRTYFVGLRNAEKAQELRDWWVSRGASDDQAVGLLEQLASGLRELALRTLNSELEWAATADVAKSHAKGSGGGDTGVERDDPAGWRPQKQMLRKSFRNGSPQPKLMRGYRPRSKKSSTNGSRRSPYSSARSKTL